MDWTQTLTILISVFGLFLVAVPFLISRMDSFQKENNAKFEQLLNRMDANQKENNAKFEAINGKFEAINGKFEAVNTRFNGLENRLTAMEVEIKNTNQRLTDFQGQMNQRLSTIEGYLVPKKVFHFEESDHKDEPKEN
jgi:chromosome segregation ATPase